MRIAGNYSAYDGGNELKLMAPKFWQKNGFLSWVLSPFGWIYGQVVRWRLSGLKKRVQIPVICVGNLTMGGAGKTPTVIALAQEFQRLGHTPHILSRGYGGKHQKALQVDKDLHTAADVGDEPLLLAQIAPTWVGSNRFDSAKAAELAGATILIMDDGLQNPGLHQDFKIGVFDGQILLANKRTFPAGPFRENFAHGLARLDHILLINFHEIPDWATGYTCTRATTTTDQIPETDRYTAFAGIGYPIKFFTLLKDKGFNLVQAISFPDHYMYTSHDIQMLFKEAKKQSSRLITTEKDLVKLPKDVRKNIQPLKLRLDVELAEIVNKVLTFF